MRIAIVGPAHPYKGGIAKHTTEMAHQLTRAGHEVVLYSWRHQYPFFYPGQQFVPDNQPEVALFANTQRILSWRNPLGWFRLANKLRNFDRIYLIWWVPFIQGPVYRCLLGALGKSAKNKIILLCHNVTRHEGGKLDTKLFTMVADKSGAIMVHSSQQSRFAKNLTNTTVLQADLPPVLPPRRKQRKPSYKKPKHVLLFFGLIRPYKGLDVLINALALVPDVNLLVAGEIWRDERYAEIVNELNLQNRVQFIATYLPDDQLESLFAKADALVLPYRGGTATFNPVYGHYFYVPVIATKTASMPKYISDGVDGFICEPDNVASLAEAIRKLYAPGMLQKLHAGIPEVNASTPWQAYVQVLTSEIQ